MEVEYPAKLAPLLLPARYKGAHGGRGGGKSHFYAEQVVLKTYAKKLRVVCIREVQNSIKDSVRQLIVDKIEKFGLGKEFDVLDSEIRCKRTGSLIIFKGMQSYNAENIKSLENYDIAWVEEAYGPKASLLCGFFHWVSGATDNAIYPALFLSYVSDYTTKHISWDMLVG